MKTALTIAGSDCSGGAGIQADLKTMTAHGVFGMSVITALTAQNTTGVFGVADTPADFVELQMDCVFNDIPPDAVKIGMVSSAPIIEAIARKLQQHRARNIVADPVMVSTSGGKLLSDEAVHTLTTVLLPLADLVTPNLMEAEVLWGRRIRTKSDMQRAAEEIAGRTGTRILIKGGHLDERADDLFWENGTAHWFEGLRVDNQNTHGTGCTLSSAIAAGLALGQPMEQAIQNAKTYITGALHAGLDLGHGKGPLNHCYRLFQ